MNTKKSSSAPLGAGLVVMSSLVYASYGVWVKLMGNFLGDFTQSVLRSALVVLLLLLLAIWRKQLSRIHWRRDGWLFVGLCASTLLISAPFFYAVKIIGIGLTNSVSYAGIVLGTFLFARLIIGERYTKDKWFSTVLGIVGLWLVFTPSAKTFGVLALLAALVSGLASGLDLVVTKKLQYSASQNTILTWAATLFTNVPLIFIFHESFPELHANVHWFYLVLFALASLVASWLLISGLKLIEAGAAGILGLLEIVFAVVLGILFFKEHLTLVVAVGMLSIMAAAAIPYFQHYNSQKGTLD